MKVAICTGAKTFGKNKILNRSFAKNFPGTLWIPLLAKILKKEGVDIVTGDIALSKIQSGACNGNEVMVIQELDADDGEKLISLGAVPFILTGLETPLYAYKFYDKLAKIAPKFAHRFLYPGAFKNYESQKGTNHPLYFPSFEEKDILPIQNWKKRKFLVQVISNKYWQSPKKIPLFKDLRVYPKWFLLQWAMFNSPTRKLATENELQTKRLEAIEYFGKLNKLDLFGHSWNKLTNLPLHWQKRLGKIVPSLAPKPIKDKLKTIASYKFAICFENVAYPGHTTEKIIDCFVAGVIPIYLGAPDIAKFIPKNSFIDFRDYKSMRSLKYAIENISEQSALKMISAGRKFLRSHEGRLYNYEGFAQKILDIFLKSVKKPSQKSHTLDHKFSSN